MNNITKVRLTTGKNGSGEGFDYGNGYYTPWINGNSSKTKVEVTFEEGITKIGNNTFGGCTKLQMITFPTTIQKIGISAFYNCQGMTGKLDIPNSVIEWGQQAFNRCSGVTEVHIPENETIKDIPYGMFDTCTSITKLTIPKNIETIRKVCI